MDWILRDAIIDDYEALCALFTQVDRIHADAQPTIFRHAPTPARSREFVQAILDDPDACLVVAEQNAAVIGVAEAAIRRPPNLPIIVEVGRVHINDIVVDENHRGAGVGTALLAHIEAWARTRGVRRVELNVWEFNTPARDLYERLGYHTLHRTLSKTLEE